MNRKWEFSYVVIDHLILLKKKLGVICKKGVLTEALETLRNRFKTGVKPKNFRVANSTQQKTGFVTAYDL